jgi:glycosyltransferase involved in cell wall biosynthesis
MVAELRISVVIATLNRPDSLANCLKSLEEQIVAPYEVIVVVDGELTNEVQARIDNVKNRNKLNVIQVNNGQRMGAPNSKNRGADAATGDIVAFVDDDITLAPDWTIQILRGYREHSDAVGVGGIISMQEVYFHNKFYKLFTKYREHLLRGKRGRMSFIGMPYLSLVTPVDGLLEVDFLHGGNMSFRRDVLLSHKLDESVGVRDEFDLCVRLSLREKKKLIYNSKAIAYHHHNPVGGLALWGSERLYRDFKDHVPYLLKNFNLKYLRLAVFTISVFGYSIITLKPKYNWAIVEGLRLYQNRKSGERASAILRSVEQAK